MTKAITKITSEEEAQIPIFIQKWVDMAKRPTNREEATKAVKAMYRKMGEEEPIVIFGESPYSTAYMATMFFELFQDGFNKEKLDDQLDNQLSDQLRNQLDDQLDNQLSDQLRNQLYNQLDSQLRNQLDDQLDDQLDSQLRNQLNSQLNSQLYDQLRNQLSDQLRNQLNSQLDSQLRNQLNSQLYDQLRNQLQEINGDWYMSIWWLVWCGWYDYGQYIGVEFDKEAYELFVSYVSNIGFAIPYKGVVFISENPTRIVWSQENLLHWDHGQAVEYADGWGLYMLHGVNFDKETYDKIIAGDFDMSDMVTVGSAEKATVAMRMLSPEKIIKGFDAKLIATGKKYDLMREMYGDEYCREHLPFVFNEPTKLYAIENFTGKVRRNGEKTGDTEYCMIMQHPSVKHSKYLQWVHPDIGKRADADLAQAESRRIPKEDYLMAIEA